MRKYKVSPEEAKLAQWLLDNWDALPVEEVKRPEILLAWLEEAREGAVTTTEILEMSAVEKAQECGE